MPIADPSAPLAAEALRGVWDTGVFYPKGWGYPHLGWRWPHEVHYKRGKTYHLPPTEFSVWCCDGPTDCEWIVPGTL